MPVRVPFPIPRGPIAAHPRTWGLDFNVASDDRKPFSEEGDSVVVDVCGPLVQHKGNCLDSYEAIRERCAAAFASDKNTVILRFNSPGGDFAGALELARELRATAKSAGKRLIAFTDSQCASAAYALATAADEIVITESAFVGSVGVWSALIDVTALDKAMGQNIAVLASGARKTDHNPHVPITEAAMLAAQAQVDGMAGMFFDLVAEHRGVARSAVEALEGAEHFGRKAASLGLADRTVNSFSEILSGAPMAGNFDKARKGYRESLAKLAAEDSDDGKAARAALSEMDKEEEKKAKKADSDGDGDGDGEEKKKDASASSDEEKAKGAASDEEKAKGADEKEEKAAAKAFDLAAKVHALEVKIANKEAAEERAKALAGRPDFSPQVRASLEGAPIEFVKKACAEWPRAAAPNQSSVNALTPGGTRGDTQVGGTADPKQGFTGSSDEDFISTRMGANRVDVGVKHQGNSMTLGFLSPEQARAALKATESK